jgi:CRP-like cAMP-binding protein
MDRAQLKLLAFTSEPVTFDAGHVVFRQGDTGDNAYVILDGDAEVVLETGGDGTVIARLGRYQVFGEMALLTSSPRSTTIRAGSTLSMLAIRQDVFVRLVEENAAIAVGITRMLIDRLAKTNADLNRARAASLG